jgi:hypothetical protein
VYSLRPDCPWKLWTRGGGAVRLSPGIAIQEDRSYEIPH